MKNVYTVTFREFSSGKIVVINMRRDKIAQFIELCKLLHGEDLYIDRIAKF